MKRRTTHVVRGLYTFGVAFNQLLDHFDPIKEDGQVQASPRVYRARLDQVFVLAHEFMNTSRVAIADERMQLISPTLKIGHLQEEVDHSIELEQLEDQHNVVSLWVCYVDQRSVALVEQVTEYRSVGSNKQIDNEFVYHSDINNQIELHGHVARRPVENVTLANEVTGMVEHLIESAGALRS